MQYAYLTTLLRRLPINHELHAEISDEKVRAEVGFHGESQVIKALTEIPLELRWIHNLQFLSNTSSHQIDFLLFTHFAIIVLEAKHITGMIQYNPKLQQFQRFRDGQFETFRNPFDQVHRHQNAIAEYAATWGLPLPILSAVVITSQNTTIHESFTNLPIFHLSYLSRYLHGLAQKYPVHPIHLDELQSDFQSLHRPHIYRKHNVDPDSLVLGILCNKCNNKMHYKHGLSRCPHCTYQSRLSINETIRDYYLLKGDHITNASLRHFTGIEDKFTASYILRRMAFPRFGNSIATFYKIPHQFYEHYKIWPLKKSP